MTLTIQGTPEEVVEFLKGLATQEVLVELPHNTDTTIKPTEEGG